MECAQGRPARVHGEKVDDLIQGALFPYSNGLQVAV
jgi:hypothetical protein